MAIREGQQVDTFPVQLYGWENGPVKLGLDNIGGTGGKLVPESYDEIIMNPPSQPTSVIYKKSGVVVATLTITYSGSDIASVVKT